VCHRQPLPQSLGFVQDTLRSKVKIVSRNRLAATNLVVAATSSFCVFIFSFSTQIY
jgi:hypothetical protein